MTLEKQKSRDESKLKAGCKLFSPICMPRLQVGTQGCGLPARFGSWGAQQVAFPTRADPSLSRFNNMQHHCPSRNLKAMMGLEQVKWIRWKLQTGAVVFMCSWAFASGLSGRDRGSRRDWVTKPPAGNVVGCKLQPGQTVVLISVHFSVSLGPKN